MPFDWPTEAAEKVKFDVPKEWKTQEKYCRLSYDVDRGLLKVVSADDQDEVVDVIDPEDMIGARVDIQLTSGDSTARATSAAASDGHDASSLQRATNEPQSDTLRDNQGSAVLTIYSYPRKDPSQATWMNWLGVTSYRPKQRTLVDFDRPDSAASELGERTQYHLKFAVCPSEDLKDCSKLVRALRRLARRYDTPNDDQQPKYLIVVNPMSGPRRNGVALCDDVIVPMLEQAGIDSDVFVTRCRRHAEQRMKVMQTSEDVSNYDAVVIVGGDGSAHETVNGLMARPDREELLKKLRIGLVGCGTGNGLAKSVADESNERFGLVDQCFLICKGMSLWTDVSKYETMSKSYTSVLTFSWALIADLDIESEIVYFLGEARFHLWTILRIIFLRTYKGRFSYLPASKAADKSKPLANMPMPTEPIPSSWETTEDDFILFWASTVSHASASTKQSPNSHLQDGVFQVMIIRRGLSRYKMIQILLAVDSGAHVDIPEVEFVECVAYRLEPLSPGSYNDIDGEVVESGPIQGHILPCHMQVFCNAKSYL